MPVDSLRDGVTAVGLSSPAVTIARGVARVGEVADEAYRYAKDRIFPNRPAERPAARKGDIRLPAERKASNRQVKGR